MNFPRKNMVVYCLLLLAWLTIVAWLLFEQRRVVHQSRESLLNRARDISNTIALLSRSGGPGVIRQSRLENALRELTRSGELLSVKLLNSEGEVVAEAGAPFQIRLTDFPQQEGSRWENGKVTVINPVNFGHATDSSTTGPVAIVIPNADNTSSTRKRKFSMQGPSPWNPPSPPPVTSGTQTFKMPPAGPPPPWEGPGQPSAAPNRRDAEPSGNTQGKTAQMNPPGPPPWEDGDTSAAKARRAEWRRRGGGSIFHRPPWMTEEDYQALLREQGLHGFVLVLSTASIDATIQRDLFLRIVLSAITLLAAAGAAFAWRGLIGSTKLQVRLVRANEINNHLREMNLAAAGLAHETRNPLNIVRGAAQLIAQNGAAAPELRDRAARITEEVDRITVRLNEFINYSRPLEPRPAAINLSAVVNDVARTLESDIADKKITVEISLPQVTAQADEALLRQVLFNLMLNAVQAVRQEGRVRVSLTRGAGNEACLTVSDDGPGVESSLRDEIFKPYFTTGKSGAGTGLGLAVVKQIALAHHWEVEYAASELGGAAFRLNGLILAN